MTLLGMQYASNIRSGFGIVMFESDELVGDIPLVNENTIIYQGCHSGRESKKWVYLDIRGWEYNWSQFKQKELESDFSIKLRPGKVRNELNRDPSVTQGAIWYRYPGKKKNIHRPKIWVVGSYLYSDIILPASKEIRKTEKRAAFFDKLKEKLTR